MNIGLYKYLSLIPPHTIDINCFMPEARTDTIPPLPLPRVLSEKIGPLMLLLALPKLFPFIFKEQNPTDKKNSFFFSKVSKNYIYGLLIGNMAWRGVEDSCYSANIPASHHPSDNNLVQQTTTKTLDTLYLFCYFLTHFFIYFNLLLCLKKPNI